MNHQASARLSGDTLFLEGELSFATVARLLSQLEALPLEQVRNLDCGGVTQSDSAAVSLLLSLLRGNVISLRRVGASLQGLLDLYGVADFFSNQAEE